MFGKLDRAVRVFLAMALALIALAPASSLRVQPARALFDELRIEIRPDGYNPPVCQVNRNTYANIRFVNKDSKPRRIVLDGIGVGAEFLLDTGWIAPGETQATSWTFTELQDIRYRDHDNPALTGRIIVPIPNNAEQTCEPADLPDPAGDPCVRVLPEPAGCVVIPRVLCVGLLL
ncbi:MAG: hypothetical protein AB7T37_03850 [Dehalococcoidia bacterium]